MWMGGDENVKPLEKQIAADRELGWVARFYWICFSRGALFSYLHLSKNNDTSCACKKEGGGGELIR